MTWTDAPTFKLDDDESYGNINLLVDQWARRMEAKHRTSTVYDQREGKEVTWVQALAAHQYPRVTEWLAGVPIFSARDVQEAIEWETDGNWTHHRYRRHNLPPWPVRFILPHLYGVSPCKREDHKWSVEIIEGAVNLSCDDPCPQPIVRFAENKEVWPGCIDLPDIECISGAFPVKVMTWSDSSWDDWGIEICPIFESGKCCAKCGCEIRPPRVARSRVDNSEICPECGAIEAQGDLLEYIKEQNDGCQDQG